jgi:uncharacterized membrane protein (TIGR01218 family)
MLVENTHIKRFKLITLEKRYYLADLDSNRIVWLLPFLSWLLPIKAVKITNEQYSKLKSTEKKVQSKFLIGASLPFTFLGGKLYYIQRAIKDKYIGELPVTILYVIVIVTLVLAISLRIYFSFSHQKKIQNYNLAFNNSLGEIGKIKILQINWQYIKRLLFATAGFYSMLIFCLWAYVGYQDPFFVPLIFTLVYFIFWLNIRILKPYEDMEYRFLKKQT